jgi:hypothetical protein
MTGWRLYITADKREIKDFPKLPAAISFILDTLLSVGVLHQRKMREFLVRTGVAWFCRELLLQDESFRMNSNADAP